MALESKNIITHYDFLLSNWYSGATVLSILLNNHRQITCNGETLPFPDQKPEELICSCGYSMTECEFYRYAAKHFFSNNSYKEKYFSRIPVIFDSTVLQRIFRSYLRAPMVRNLVCNMMPGFKNRIELFINLNDEFYNQACEYDKTNIYLDGVKSPRRAEIFAQYGNKPIRVLHSIRDGRKFLASYIKVYKLSEEEIPKHAKNWVEYIKMVEMLKQRFPNIQIKEVRHEDLCHDKESVIKEVCNFFGVEYDPNIFVFNDSTYHLLGNKLRKQFDGVIRENDKWKSVYSNYSKKIYQEVTSIQEEYLIKYDYL